MSARALAKFPECHRGLLVLVDPKSNEGPVGGSRFERFDEIAEWVHEFGSFLRQNKCQRMLWVQ